MAVARGIRAYRGPPIPCEESSPRIPDDGWAYPEREPPSINHMQSLGYAGMIGARDIRAMQGPPTRRAERPHRSAYEGCGQMEANLSSPPSLGSCNDDPRLVEIASLAARARSAENALMAARAQHTKVTERLGAELLLAQDRADAAVSASEALQSEQSFGSASPYHANHEAEWRAACAPVAVEEARCLQMPPSYAPVPRYAHAQQALQGAATVWPGPGGAAAMAAAVSPHHHWQVQGAQYSQPAVSTVAPPAESASCPPSILAERRRMFGSRPFRLWVEDYPLRGGIRVLAMDVMSLAQTHAELRDSDIQTMFDQFSHKSTLETVDPDKEMNEFLCSLLDSAYFELNGAGDALELRLTCSDHVEDHDHWQMRTHKRANNANYLLASEQAADCSRREQAADCSRLGKAPAKRLETCPPWTRRPPAPHGIPAPSVLQQTKPGAEPPLSKSWIRQNLLASGYGDVARPPLPGKRPSTRSTRTGTRPSSARSARPQSAGPSVTSTCSNDSRRERPATAVYPQQRMQAPTPTPANSLGPKEAVPRQQRPQSARARMGTHHAPSQSQATVGAPRSRGASIGLASDAASLAATAAAIVAQDHIVSAPPKLRPPRPVSAKALKHRRVHDDVNDPTVYEDNSDDGAGNDSEYIEHLIMDEHHVGDASGYGSRFSGCCGGSPPCEAFGVPQLEEQLLTCTQWESRVHQPFAEPSPLASRGEPYI